MSKRKFKKSPEVSSRIALDACLGLVSVFRSAYGVLKVSDGRKRSW